MGSFLNVVVERLRHKESFLRGRSHCPHCKKTLGILDLVPIFSFLFLMGRCRHCHKKISWQYFFMELGTGLIFSLIYINFDFKLPTTYYLLISCFLIIIFLYDFKYYLILDKITIPAIIIALAGNLLLGQVWWELLLGAAIAAGFFLLQFLVSKGKWIGGGDIRLGVLMGLILGWKLVLIALFIAYGIGAVFGIILILCKKKKLSSSMPFGTFLTLATFITLIYGNIILEWYLNMLYL